MEKLLTIRELAERLNIAEGTAYHWLSEGRLRCVRFSKRCVRFRENDVVQMLDQLSTGKSQMPEAKLDPAFKSRPSRRSSIKSELKEGQKHD